MDGSISRKFNKLITSKFNPFPELIIPSGDRHHKDDHVYCPNLFEQAPLYLPQKEQVALLELRQADREDEIALSEI